MSHKESLNGNRTESVVQHQILQTEQHEKMSTSTVLTSLSDDFNKVAVAAEKQSRYSAVYVGKELHATLESAELNNTCDLNSTEDVNPSDKLITTKNDCSHKKDRKVSNSHKNGQKKKATESAAQVLTDQPVTGADDKLLLDLIRSADVSKALLVLQRGKTVSQNGLDKSLISACQYGHKYLVLTLVRLGADVQFRDSIRNTPLLICAEQGFIELVRFFIKNKADINSANSDGDTALILSVHVSGSADVLKLLLEQKQINIHHRNRLGYTALMKAVEVMDIDAITVLLKKSFTQNQRSRKGYTNNVDWEFLDHYKNMKGETVEQIAVRSNLWKVFQILKYHVSRNVSPLKIAIERCDCESFALFLQYENASANEKMYVLEDAFREIFSKYQTKCKKRFDNKDITVVEMLIASGVNVNIPLSKASSAISVAVKTGSCALIELLCKHGALLEQPAHYGQESNPLNIAANNGRIDLIKLLLKYQPDINKDVAMETALSQGHLDCAKLLIQHGAQINIYGALRSVITHQKTQSFQFLLQTYQHETKTFLRSGIDGIDLLVLAIKKGNVKIIGLIIDLGVNINTCDEKGLWPIVESRNSEVARFLIRKGADVISAADGQSTNDSPLIQVLVKRCKYDHAIVEVVGVFLESGASVNERSHDGKTPLLITAVKDGSQNVMKCLLDHGADLSSKDKHGNTALILAVSENCTENASFLLQLVNKDVLNEQNCDGLTALMVAVSRKDIRIINELIDHGADVGITDVNGNTALHLALKLVYDSEVVVKLLIAAGSDVSHQNKDGFSPLMLAASKHNVNAISQLLDAGADVNAVNKSDNTKTAISCLQDIPYLGRNFILCMNSLLGKGAKASYLHSRILHNIIILGLTDAVLKLMHSGLGPADVRSSQTLLGLLEDARISVVSPLSVALIAGNVILARCFIENLFLTASDLISTLQNKEIRKVITRLRRKACVDLLEEMCTQPMPLFMLAFVAVSSAVGTSPGREDRVANLPLPQVMKDKLLFVSHEASLEASDALRISDFDQFLMDNVLSNNYSDLDESDYSDEIYSSDYDYYDLTASAIVI